MATASGAGDRGRWCQLSIEVCNESGAELDEVALAALARHVLGELRVHPLAELSILLVDEPAMAGLHERWLGEPGPTDVLAFPMDQLLPPQPGGPRAGSPDEGDDEAEEGSELLLGDVVLCPEVAAAQAPAAGHSLADELELLCTHGILHLLGYDHGEPGERATMFGLQDRLLASWRSARSAGDG
jgi:probable rRNA maturation factor